MNAKEKQTYRTKLYEDLYSGIIPDRFPVSDGFSIEYMIQYAGKDLLTTQYEYDTETLIEIMEKAMEIARGDNFGVAYARNPVALMFSQSRGFVMSKTGFIQHPEISGFSADEYDDFIKNPHEFTIDTILPRLHKGYAGSPAQFVFNYMKNYLATQEMMKCFAQANNYIKEKYGFFAAPPGSSGMTTPPFDVLADFNRGFSNITIDIKRHPQKVLDAMEALMPLAIKRQKVPKVDLLGCSRIMTHMAVFLNNKDFEKFYWPTFYKLCHIAGERGQHMFIFCEGDWTRFADHLQDLPSGARLWFEYGDAQTLKDKLGKKHILAGLYPLTLLKNGTKEQCLDKAKELIDIMAPGGNFYFDFDKHALNIGDINPDNYRAVLEYCLENGKYDNAGQRSIAYNFEDTVEHYLEQYPPFQSKYVVSFDDFMKEYPPADERAIPAMRRAYEKINRIAPYEIR